MLTRWQILVAYFVATAVIGWAALNAWERGGNPPLPVPWYAAALIVLIAAIVFYFGWTVRSYLAGRRPSLSGVRAARTAVLAKASAYTGAVLSGWYVANLVMVIPNLVSDARISRAVAAGLCLLASLTLVVVALIAERWCQLPPPGSGDAKRTERSSSPSPASQNRAHDA